MQTNRQQQQTHQTADHLSFGVEQGGSMVMMGNFNFNGVLNGEHGESVQGDIGWGTDWGTERQARHIFHRSMSWTV